MKNIASPILRIVAATIDALLSLSITLILVLNVLSATNPAEVISRTVSSVTLLLILNLLLVLVQSLLTSLIGGSLGKILTGLQVVSPNGQKVSFKHSLFRTFIAYPASSILLGAGYWWIFKDKNHQGWHDLLCDTYVVVKNSSGAALGAISLLLLAGLNIYLGMSIFSSLNTNKQTYSEIASEIKLEAARLAATPTPSPTPISSLTPRQISTPTPTALSQAARPLPPKNTTPVKIVTTEQSIIVSDLSIKLSGSEISPYQLTWTNSDGSEGVSSGYSVTVPGNLGQVSDYFVKNGFSKISPTAWSRNTSVCAVLDSNASPLNVVCVVRPDIK